MIQKDMTARNVACEAIVGLVDQGSLYSCGHLSLYTSDATRLTWHNLTAGEGGSAFGVSVDGTSTANTIYDATTIMDGTAARFAFENWDGSSIWSGDVTLVGHGGSLQLESVSLVKDTTVSIASAIYVVPA
jgi:hypothetical protein